MIKIKIRLYIERDSFITFFYSVLLEPYRTKDRNLQVGRQAFARVKPTALAARWPAWPTGQIWTVRLGRSCVGASMANRRDRAWINHGGL